MTTRLTIADLLTAEGWQKRAAEEAAAGRAVVAAVWCRACNGAVPGLWSDGSLLDARVVTEFCARACHCGDVVPSNNFTTAHGLADGSGAYGARPD